jgi:hypothetical protein
MKNRINQIFILIMVFILTACAPAQVLSKPTLQPTPTTESTATPIPTSITAPTPTKPVETATPLSPTVLPTESSHAPVIKSVDMHQVESDGNMTVYQDILFEDAKGDVYYVDYEIISSTAETKWVVDGPVNAPAQEQQSGAKVTGTLDCESNSYEVNLSMRLYDKAGNKSFPYKYKVMCGAGVVPVGFPDPFDDNRNGWWVDDEISISDGKLLFRNIPEGLSQWVWCVECRVNSDQNTASVEASWSNTPNASLGLLIDDSTCTPDGLVFVIGPFGYYSILQSVRDASGEWSHWRDFISWTKSSLIRKAQNATNVISASYEFGDELHVTFYLNGSRVTRVRVYGYNGSKECRPGLFADSGLEANFDNFTISSAKP